MPEAKVGSAFVEVLPDLSGFAHDLDRQMRKAAPDVGEKVGQQLGRTMAREMTQQMRRGLDDVEDAAESVGDDAGRRFANHFTDEALPRINESLKKIADRGRDIGRDFVSNFVSQFRGIGDILRNAIGDPLGALRDLIGNITATLTQAGQAVGRRATAALKEARRARPARVSAEGASASAVGKPGGVLGALLGVKAVEKLLSRRRREDGEEAEKVSRRTVIVPAPREATEDTTDESIRTLRQLEKTLRRLQAQMQRGQGGGGAVLHAEALQKEIAERRAELGAAAPPEMSPRGRLAQGINERLRTFARDIFRNERGSLSFGGGGDRYLSKYQADLKALSDETMDAKRSIEQFRDGIVELFHRLSRELKGRGETQQAEFARVQSEIFRLTDKHAMGEEPGVYVENMTREAERALHEIRRYTAEASLGDVSGAFREEAHRLGVLLREINDSVLWVRRSVASVGEGLDGLGRKLCACMDKHMGKGAAAAGKPDALEALTYDKMLAKAAKKGVLFTERKPEAGEGVQGVEAKAVFTMLERLADQVRRMGGSITEMVELPPTQESAELFHKMIGASKAQMQFGPAVEQKSVEDYMKSRMFLSKAGDIGFALKDDDIVSVFSSPKVKKALSTMIPLALQEGGRRLDAFAPKLPKLYGRYGFKTGGRVKFDPDYAPEGWDFERQGMPDIHLMGASKAGRPAKEFTGDQWDDAAALVDRIIETGSAEPGMQDVVDSIDRLTKRLGGRSMTSLEGVGLPEDWRSTFKSLRDEALDSADGLERFRVAVNEALDRMHHSLSQTPGLGDFASEPALTRNDVNALMRSRPDPHFGEQEAGMVNKVARMLERQALRVEALTEASSPEHLIRELRTLGKGMRDELFHVRQAVKGVADAMKECCQSLSGVVEGPNEEGEDATRFAAIQVTSAVDAAADSLCGCIKQHVQTGLDSVVVAIRSLEHFVHQGTLETVEGFGHVRTLLGNVRDAVAEYSVSEDQLSNWFHRLINAVTIVEQSVDGAAHSINLLHASIKDEGQKLRAMLTAPAGRPLSEEDIPEEFRGMKGWSWTSGPEVAPIFENLDREITRAIRHGLTDSGFESLAENIDSIQRHMVGFTDSLAHASNAVFRVRDSFDSMKSAVQDIIVTLERLRLDMQQGLGGYDEEGARSGVGPIESAIDALRQNVITGLDRIFQSIAGVGVAIRAQTVSVEGTESAVKDLLRVTQARAAGKPLGDLGEHLDLLREAEAEHGEAATNENALIHLADYIKEMERRIRDILPELRRLSFDKTANEAELLAATFKKLYREALEVEHGTEQWDRALEASRAAMKRMMDQIGTVGAGGVGPGLDRMEKGLDQINRTLFDLVDVIRKTTNEFGLIRKPLDDAKDRLTDLVVSLGRLSVEFDELRRTMDRTSGEGGDEGSVVKAIRAMSDEVVKKLDTEFTALRRLISRSSDRGGSPDVDLGGGDVGAVQPEAAAKVGGGIAALLASWQAMLAAAALATGGGFIAGFVKAVGVGSQWDTAFSRIRALLGQRGGKVARETGEAAGEVYADGWGESIGEVAEVTARVLRDLPKGSTGRNEFGLLELVGLDPEKDRSLLKQYTEEIMAIADLTGEDTRRVIAATRQLVSTGLAKDTAEALDIIAYSAQELNDPLEENIDTWIEYSTQFRKLGISGKGVVGILDQIVEAGAPSLDKAADALKEFSIRAVDGSELTATSLSQIGLSVEEIAGDIAKGGPHAEKAFRKVIKGLQDLYRKNPVTANIAGVGLFGTQFEDLGAALLSIDPNKLQVQADGAAGQIVTALSSSLSAQWQSFKATISNMIGQFFNDPSALNGGKRLSFNLLGEGAFRGFTFEFQGGMLGALATAMKTTTEVFTGKIAPEQGGRIVAALLREVLNALTSLFTGKATGEATTTVGTFFETIFNDPNLRKSLNTLIGVLSAWFWEDVVPELEKIGKAIGGAIWDGIWTAIQAGIEDTPGSVWDALLPDWANVDLGEDFRDTVEKDKGKGKKEKQAYAPKSSQPGGPGGASYPSSARTLEDRGMVSSSTTWTVSGDFYGISDPAEMMRQLQQRAKLAALAGTR